MRREPTDARTEEEHAPIDSSRTQYDKDETFCRRCAFTRRGSDESNSPSAAHAPYRQMYSIGTGANLVQAAAQLIAHGANMPDQCARSVRQLRHIPVRQWIGVLASGHAVKLLLLNWD